MRVGILRRVSFEETELRFSEEAVKLEIELVWIRYSDLRLVEGRIFYGDDDLADLDGLYVRSIGQEIEWGKLITEYAKIKRIKLIDDYILKHGILQRFKSVASLRLADTSINYPKTTFVNKIKDLKNELLNWSFPVVVKLSSGGRHGMGTFFLRSMEDWGEFEIKLKERNEMMKQEGKKQTKYRGFLIQEFIENDGDYRVMTVGYKCIGGFKRQPKIEKMLMNKSIGKSVKVDVLPNDLIELAEKAAEILGIEVAGTDIVKSKKDGKFYLIEVNEAPQFVVFEKRTGVNAASEILKYCAKKFRVE